MIFSTKFVKSLKEFRKSTPSIIYLHLRITLYYICTYIWSAQCIFFFFDVLNSLSNNTNKRSLRLVAATVTLLAFERAAAIKIRFSTKAMQQMRKVEMAWMPYSAKTLYSHRNKLLCISQPHSLTRKIAGNDLCPQAQRTTDGAAPRPLQMNFERNDECKECVVANTWAAVFSMLRCKCS